MVDASTQWENNITHHDAITQWEDSHIADHLYGNWHLKEASCNTDDITSAECSQSEYSQPECSQLTSGSEYIPSQTSVNTSSKETVDDDVELEGDEDTSVADSFIVSSASLFQLFKFCPSCGSEVTSRTSTTKGTVMIVQYTCRKGCNDVWRTEEVVQKKYIGNLKAAAAVLFTGNQFAKIQSLFSLMGVAFISETTFFRIQEEHLFPTIASVYNSHMDSILGAIQGEPVFLAGDGQCDSPGFNAKYCTYTIMCDETDFVLASKVVSVSEVGSSYAMELEGLKRCLAEVEAHGVNFSGIVTDRHCQVTAYLKNSYPNKDHQVDIFHVAKSITKELTNKGRQSQCEAVLPWIQAISNHFWWSCATCNSDEVVSIVNVHKSLLNFE